MLLKEQGDLVPGRATLEVDQEQDLILVVEAGDSFEDLRPEVIWPHVGRERHGGDVLLRAKDHLAGHLDALGERVVTG